MDKFEQMYAQQSGFLELLRDKRQHPNFPLDLSKKENQQFLKTLLLQRLQTVLQLALIFIGLQLMLLNHIKFFQTNQLKLNCR